MKAKFTLPENNIKAKFTVQKFVPADEYYTKEEVDNKIDVVSDALGEVAEDIDVLKDTSATKDELKKEITDVNAHITTVEEEINKELSTKASIDSVEAIEDELPNFATKSQIETIQGDISHLSIDIIGLDTNKQDILVSGTNIKTINNTSILGSGNIEIKGDDKTKLSEFTDDLGSSPIHTHNQYYLSSNPDEYITKDVNDLTNYTLTSELGMMAYADKVSNGDIDGTINQDKITNLSTTLANKQDVINDLSTIRTNADAGKTASDTISTYGNIVTHSVSEFATSNQGALADSALQPNDNITELTNDAGYITSSYHDSTKQDTLYYIITEDIVTVERDDTKGVAPYNTSYGYTNITINADSGIEWKEGATYYFVINTEMVVTSAYRNTRVRIGTSGDWKPVYFSSAIAVGSSYFTKAYNTICTYKNTYQTAGAVHIISDNNSTYSAMSATEITTGTATSARSISAKVLNDWLKSYYNRITGYDATKTQVLKNVSGTFQWVDE